MRKRKTFSINAFANICMGAVLFVSGLACGAMLSEIMREDPEPVEIIQVQKEIEKEYIEVPQYKTLEIVHEVVKERVPEVMLTDEEKALIARVVCAEAGTEDLIGKRLVADTVLNRVDKIGFGDTVQDVVYGAGQYYMSAGYTDDCMLAVEMECYERLDYDIVWFCNSGWMPYGRPAFTHGNHWFSFYNNGENVNLEDVRMGGAGYDR